MGRVFLRGLLAVLPITLTLWLLWWLATVAEQTLGAAFRWVLGEEYYLPGLGILAGVGVIFFIGLMTRAWVFRVLADWVEGQFQRLPLVKPIYSSIRDFVRFFRQDSAEQLGRPVFVHQNGFRVVGFVTNESAAALGRAGEVVVYLPMGYQLGGYSVVVAADRIEPIENLNTSEAMRYVLTAGIGSEGAPPAAKG